MTHTALIVAPGATPSSVATTLDMFNVAGRFLAGGNCRGTLLSASGGDIHLSAAVCVSTQAMPEVLNGFDALIIPGFFATDTVTLFGQLHSEWLPSQHGLKNSVVIRS